MPWSVILLWILLRKMKSWKGILLTFAFLFFMFFSDFNFINEVIDGWQNPKSPSCQL